MNPPGTFQHERPFSLLIYQQEMGYHKCDICGILSEEIHCVSCRAWLREIFNTLEESCRRRQSL